jgi:hypothetical protein
LVDLEKSASFGTESALVGSKAPKGQARAFEAGIRAGYTPEETRKLISDTAARITGVVDNKPAEPAATPSKFVTDFMAATPQKPVAPMTATERVSSGLDKSFFGGLSGAKPAVAVTPTATPAAPPTQQPTRMFPTLEEFEKKTKQKTTFVPRTTEEPKGLRAIGRGLETMRPWRPWESFSNFMNSL